MPSRVLVVDDTPALLDLVRDFLTAEGYEVATCLFSRQAYPMARQVRPRVILLDIVMPEVSGWDVLEQLRADPQLRTVPIVICTAWAEQAAARMEELRQPDLWLLPKPFDADDLIATVGEAIELAGRVQPDDAGRPD
jgi:CheY-like chemotaxis protein